MQPEYRTPYRTCTGKVGFVTAAEARDWERHAQRHRGGPRKHPYRCPFCGNFHLGTKRRVKGSNQYK